MRVRGNGDVRTGTQGYTDYVYIPKQGTTLVPETGDEKMTQENFKVGDFVYKKDISNGVVYKWKIVEQLSPDTFLLKRRTRAFDERWNGCMDLVFCSKEEIYKTKQGAKDEL